MSLSIRPARALLLVAVMVTGLAIVMGDATPALGADESLILRDQLFFATDGLSFEYELAGDSLTAESFATTTTTTTTTVPDEVDEIGIDIDSQDAPDAEESTTTTLAIPEPISADAALVRVAVHHPVSDRFRVAESLSGDPGPIVDVWTAPIADLIDPDADSDHVVLNLTPPIELRSGPQPRLEPVLEIGDFGLTPVSVSVLLDGRVVAEHTTIVDIGLSSLAPAPMEIAVVAAIGGSDTVLGERPTVVDETTRQLRVRAEVGALFGVLTTSSFPVMVAWDPALNGTLAEGGLTTGLDGSFTEAMASSAELSALPDRRIDPSAAVGAGLEAFFADEMIRGEAALAESIPETPISRAVWFAHPSVTETALTMQGARLLRSIGTEAVVMTWDAFVRYDGLPDGPIDTSIGAELDLGAGDTLPVLVVDPLSGLFDVNADVSGISPIDRAIRFLAEMTVLRRDDPSLRRRVLISGDDLTPPDPTTVAALEQLLINDPAGVSGEPLSASSATGDVDQSVGLVWKEGPDVDLATRRLVLQGLLDAVDDIATMLPDGDQRPAEWTSRLLDLYESRIGVTRFDADVASTSQDIETIRSAVVLPTSGTFNLTGRDSPLPLQIENSGDTPLSVLVRIESAKLEVPPEPVAVTLQPGATVVRVDVAARANGTFPVLVEVLSPGGVPVIEATTVTARANSVTGLGRLVAVGLILVLLSWWYSHLRKRRRERISTTVASSVQAHPSGSRPSDT